MRHRSLFTYTNVTTITPCREKTQIKFSSLELFLLQGISWNCKLGSKCLFREVVRIRMNKRTVMMLCAMIFLKGSYQRKKDRAGKSAEVWIIRRQPQLDPVGTRGPSWNSFRQLCRRFQTNITFQDFFFLFF